MRTEDWEDLCAVVKELRLTTINSGNLIGDDDLRMISQFEQITSLDLNDEAMRHIAALPKLRMLMGQGTVATDDGSDT
jgi:hypothetical protein